MALTADPRQLRQQLDRPAWFRLNCPAGCPSILVKGTDEAARAVREHPAVCPDPGRVIPGSTVYPMVCADPVAR